MPGPVAIAGVVFAIFAVAPAPAQTPTAPRQTASIKLTTTKPGSPTGSELSVEMRDPANPEGKPYSVARIVLRLSPGSVIDTSVPVQCKATDAELLAIGPDACPAESLVNQGTIVSDTGGAVGPFPRLIENEVKNFNNEGELVGVATSTNAPVVPGLTRIVTRSKISEGTITFVLPGPFPGSPPPDNYTAMKSLHVSGPPIVRNGHAYALTPPTCPESGRWTGSATFEYHDGVSQIVESSSPCDRSASAGKPRLRLRLSGPRDRRVQGGACFAGPVRASVVGPDSRQARRVEFFMGGRRVAADGSRPLRRTFDRRRHRGSPHFHRARARVGMADGRSVLLRRRYRVCGGSR